MKIKNINKSYAEKNLFKDFSLEFENGKVTSIMGNSGIGKTTLLKMIAGLTHYDGIIETNGNVSYIFGESSLIPSLTVKQNLEYAIAHVITNKIEREKLIIDILRELEIEDEINKYPLSLSTGMAQRVALARGFLYPAETLITDEPFRGLDTVLKRKLQKYFLKLLSKENKTVILITHDITEALLLSNRILVFGGRPIEVKADFKLTSKLDERSLSDEDIAFTSNKLLNVLENQ